MELKGKSAIITGGTKGIGRSIAEALVKEGVNVCVCARKEEEIEAAVREIGDLADVTVTGVVCDVRNYDAVKAMFDHATTELGGMIAQEFRPRRPELVAGPTTGGIILAYEVARQLGVNAVYVERGESGGRVLRRGFEISPGARVLVVDDVVTTGGSVAETQACITNAGGVVIGIGVLADRTAGRAATDVPFFACLTVDFPSYPQDSCPQCAAGIPVAAPRGSGKKVPA